MIQKKQIEQFITKFIEKRSSFNHQITNYQLTEIILNLYGFKQLNCRINIKLSNKIHNILIDFGYNFKRNIEYEKQYSYRVRVEKYPKYCNHTKTIYNISLSKSEPDRRVWANFLKLSNL